MLTQQERELLVRTARKVITAQVVHDPEIACHEFASVQDIYQRFTHLQEPVGVFVTLKQKDPESADSELRGCIGSIIGREPLYEGGRRLAVESAFFDPRFPPVTEQELDDLLIELSVLSEPKEIDSYHDIILGRDGIILTCSGRTAVFLPQVAEEQGWDLETTLTHLSLKAGLDPDAWLETSCTYRVFQAEVFQEGQVQDE